nr:Cas9 endonuclease PAM-interacting domain-containing protein [Apilactobacillus kunkeei]
MLITREVSTKNGQLSDQTVYSAKRINNVKAPIPVKKDSNPELYGFRTGNVDHHMVIVKYPKKDSYDYKVVGIPLRFVQKLKETKDNKDYENLLNQIVQMKLNRKKQDFIVVVDNVMYGQLIQDGGEKYTLGSSTYKYNAKQLVINMDKTRILEDNRYLNSLDEGEVSEKLVNIYNDIMKVVNSRFDLFDINKFREKLNDGLNKFKNISNEQKEETLLKILSGLHCGSANVPIKELGLTTPLGKLQLPSGIVLSEEAVVIYQSPSGLFENKVRLKDL